MLTAARAFSPADNFLKKFETAWRWSIVDFIFLACVVGAVAAYVICLKMGKLLDLKYLKSHYVSRSLFTGLNFYQHLFAIFNPRQYLRESNLADSYSYYMIYVLIGFLGAVCATIALVRVVP